MSKYRFSNAERWAIFSVYDQHCYICRRPLDFRSMVVDHIIPENLLDDGRSLQKILDDLGLSPSFSINDFGNWLPACAPCNLKKSTAIFRSTPLIQIELDRCAGKATKAKKVAEKSVSDKQIGNAFAAIQRASEQKTLDPKDIAPLIKDFIRNNPDVAKLLKENLATTKLAFAVEERFFELRLTANQRAVFSDLGVRIEQGTHGVGYAPDGDRFH